MATYILNQPKISIEEVYEAGKMLNKFADDFETFYGRDSITMNIHMLRHYAENVLNSGPLWSQSMFGFETRIGDFKLCERSKVCISQSIAAKYCLDDFESIEPDTSNATIKIFRKKK